jgi:hypothetical protein
VRRDVNRGLLAAIGTAAAAVMPAGPISAGGGKGSGGGPGIGRGPNSNTAPYLLPVAPGVRITSLLTVSDGGAASNGYELVGIPDGLGATSGIGDIDFTLYGNHECSTLRSTRPTRIRPSSSMASSWR